MRNLTHSVLAALVASTFVSLPTVAQERSIGGVAVPDSQLEAVQQKCDELLAEGEADVDEAAPAAEAPAAGASNDPATTESAAEAPVDPTAETSNGNMAADSEAETAIDLAMLTVEACEDGGFAEPSM
ncbi:hypothetical protein [Devosia nitrariae]|uniref:HdeA/HdeB family protein n=1 Tax=Devosia nitrariae TaxID=2071872 RepID=A0ABQ5W813_9HYPH|nr:hypothetical protein [Devosia nitrariae]GLQ56112.1 hypothetical protein GCM10010862_33710 [Devosia nitrariae]